MMRASRASQLIGVVSILEFLGKIPGCLVGRKMKIIVFKRDGEKIGGGPEGKMFL